MNKTVFLVLRIIFGLALVFFGANKFFNFMPPPAEMPESVMAYFIGLASSQTLNLVGVVEVLAGLSLLVNKYAPLLMVILMSISVCAVLFHATLDPANSVGAIILLILNIAMLYAYKSRYTEILKP